MSRGFSKELRNATVINMVDGCAVFIPVHEQGEAPVGLMLCGAHGNDRRVLALGCAIEDFLGA